MWLLFPGHLQSRIVSATLPSGWGQQEDTCSSAGAAQHLQGLSKIQEINCLLHREEGAIFIPYLMQRGQQQAGLMVLVCSKGFCLVPCNSPRKTLASELSLQGDRIWRRIHPASPGQNPLCLLPPFN